MDMKIVKREKCLCPCCMENHEIKKVPIANEAAFKNRKAAYEASYWYCDVAEELYMDEQQMQENDTRLKEAYQKILVSANELKIGGMNM